MTVERATTVEETLNKIAVRVLRKKDVKLTPTSTFKELGADSLDVVQILVALEEAYDIELIDEDLKAVTNLGEFIAYVKKRVAAKK